MSEDESVSDCDEGFSLYGSKKVIETFKTQLKKIAANNHLTKPYSYVNNRDIHCEEDGNVEDPTLKKQQDPLLECIEVPDVDLTVTLLENNDSTEDSIEVITEFPSRQQQSRRRSERLRRRTRARDREWNQPSSIPANKEPQARQRGNKRKKQKGAPVEVILHDSPQPTENDDELNPEFTVKVIWKSVNVKKFQIRKFQKLSFVFEQLSKEENIPQDKIILTFNNVKVDRNDTPDSLNLQVYHFLDGGVLSELSNSCQTPESQKLHLNGESVALKFQDVNKRIVKLSLNKNEKLKVAMIKCSEQLEVPLSRIKFFFDGELLNPSETPETLGLENEEIIDIKISG